MKNIHLIRTRRPHWGKYSGINQFLNYINPDFYHVDVYTASDNDEDFPIKHQGLRDWLRQVVQSRGMGYYKLSDLTAELRALKKCWKPKVDVIHYLDGEHSAQYLPYLSKLPRKARPKFVVSYHQPPELLGSLVRQDVIRKLDGIILVSPEQVSFFQGLVEPEKIHVILHGIDTHYFRPGTEPKERGKFKCLTVGHWLRDYDTVRVVAQALAAHPEIEFHIVVSGRTGPKTLGLEDLPNVTLYRDTISDADLLKQLQQASILFLPLLRSTANNALLEAIACGLPIVSTLLPSVQAYLPGKEAILIQDNDAKQFIETILYLSRHSDVLEDMAVKARHRAEELDWQKISLLYETVYSQVIGD